MQIKSTFVNPNSTVYWQKFVIPNYTSYTYLDYSLNTDLSHVSHTYWDEKPSLIQTLGI